VSSAAPSTPHQHKHKSFVRLVVILLILIAAVAAVTLTPIKSWLGSADSVRQSIASLGLWTYPVCTIASAILVACGVPRILLCGIGGAVLGPVWGIITTQTGAVLGYYCVFLFVRWGGRDVVLHRWPKLQKWASAIEQQGVVGVILIRQLPIHGTLMNLCFGLSHLKHRHFLIGTAIGLIPEAIPAALVGAGLAKGATKDTVGYIILAVVVFALVAFLSRQLMRKLRNTNQGSAMMAEMTSIEGVNE
jgi:uncharacterized membrane protein YdjX (TVP38/TMEM64 family)